MAARIRNRSKADEVNMTRFANDQVKNVWLQTSFSQTEMMTDTVTPGYYGKIAAGEIVNNALNYTSDTIEFSENTGNLTLTEKSSPYTVYTYADGNVTQLWIDFIWSPLITNYCPDLSGLDVEGIAKQECIAKVDRTPNEFFEDLAEVRETIKFLRNPLGGIQRLVNSFVKKRKDLNKWKESWEKTQALAALWTEYRFAVSPLLRSATELLDLLALPAQPRPKRRTAHGRARNENVMSKPVSIDWGLIFLNQTFRYETIGSRFIDTHATILYEVSNPIADWRFKLGLRNKDIPTVMWEIIPYSFMLDRLIHIRNSISGIVNFIDPSVTFLAGSYTEKTISEYSWSMTSYTSALYNTTFDKPDSIAYNDYSQTRLPWVPSFWETLPNWTPGNLVKDLTITLDLIAILVNSLPRA